MKTKTIGTLILASTLTFGGFSYAVAANQEGMKNQQNCTMTQEDGRGKYRGGKHQGKKGNRQGGFEKLNLTEQQQQQMKSIMSANNGKNKQRKTDSERLAQRAEMQALMHAETFDEERAQELINNQGSKNNERKLAKMKARHEMFQLLTDEQKAQFTEMQMQRNNRQNR